MFGIQAVTHKGAEFEELRVFVDKIIYALACGQFALSVLLIDAFFAAAEVNFGPIWQKDSLTEERWTVSIQSVEYSLLNVLQEPVQAVVAVVVQGVGFLCNNNRISHN